MSEDVTEEKKKSKSKDKKVEPKEQSDKTHVEPMPSNMRVFEWVENLFMADNEMPELIEIRLSKGKNHESYGQRIKQFPFTASNTKPDREKLVALSNKIVQAMQMHTDVKQKPTVFIMTATNLVRDSEPYDVALIQFKPGSAHRFAAANGELAVNEEDDEASPEKRFSVQMTGMVKDMYETTLQGLTGIIDRQDRTIERFLSRMNDMEDRHFRMFDTVERALSLEQEREEKRRRNELWNKGVEKGLEMVSAIGPPIVNAIVGKSVIPQPVDPDVAELKKFMKSAREGGKLTEEQSMALFGVYDQQTGQLMQPGVLDTNQVATLFQVANGQMPANELDQLLPGGSVEITTEQMMQMQQIFANSMDQVVPLVLMFNARKQRREQGQ